MDRMKKRLFLMLGVLAVSVVMQAQPKAGTISVIPRVGINFANLTNNEVVVDLANQSKTLKSRIKPGLTIGVDGELQATDMLSLSIGMHYSMQGSRYPDFERSDGDFVEGYSDWHTNYDYLNLPLLVGCRIADGFSVKTGVQVGMLVGAKDKLSVTEIIPMEIGGRKQGNAVGKTENMMDACKKMDISIPVGVSYEFNDVIIDARYNFGLTRVYKLEAVKSRNSVIQLSVGYRLHL